MKVNRIHRACKKAGIRIGYLLALAVTLLQIHVLFAQGRHPGYQQEAGETAPVPCQDVYLPPW